MTLLPTLGQVALTAPEAALIARALDKYAAEQCDTKNETYLLLLFALQSAFQALALAEAFEFHMKPDAQSEALSWSGFLTKEETHEQG